MTIKKLNSAEKKIRTFKIFIECQELKLCIDRCCGGVPAVNHKRSVFCILCKSCDNKVEHADATKAMITWNKKIRQDEKQQQKKKLLNDKKQKMLDAIRNITLR